MNPYAVMGNPPDKMYWPAITNATEWSSPPPVVAAHPSPENDADRIWQAVQDIARST